LVTALGVSLVQAQGAKVIKIASQSPLSGGQSVLGVGLRNGTELGGTLAAPLLLAMTFGASLTGWLMLSGAALFEGSLFAVGQTTWRGWIAVAFLGLCGTALAFTWYAEGVQRIGATRSAAFINLVPLSAVILGALLLDERLSLAVLVGGALVITGVIITNRAAASRATAANSKEKTA